MSRSGFDGSTIASAMGGMLGFAGGVYLIANGSIAVGIAVLMIGIAFEALTLSRMIARARNNRDGGNA